jgi:replication factor A1
MEDEFAPHVDEIKRALDNEIEESSILADLKKLIEFRVPLEEAKRSLIKKYGGADKSIVCKLDHIKIGDRNIEFTAQVMELTKKSINVNTIEKTIFSGILGDETAARSFTAWHDFGLNAGDVVHITQAYVRNWQDRPEINFGSKSKVTKLNTTIAINPEILHKKLAELRDGDVNVNAVFTILSIEQREIITKDGSKNILNGIGADDKTKAPFTSWVLLPELVAGNTIDVKNAYVRSFRGVPTLHINENSKVKKLEKSIEFKEPKNVMIRDIIESEGAFDVVIEGNILSVRPGSGLIARCPECSRVIQKGMCRVHGKVEEKLDMRIKAIIDDGTGAMTLVLNAELTQALSGITIEQAKEIAKAAMSQNAVEEEVKKKLLGKMLTVRGNMSKGEYGITLVATKVRESHDQINERALELLSRAGQHG